MCSSQLNVDQMVRNILAHNRVEISSRYTSDSGEVTFSFSCPAEVSELNTAYLALKDQLAVLQAEVRKEPRNER